MHLFKNKCQENGPFYYNEMRLNERKKTLHKTNLLSKPQNRNIRENYISQSTCFSQWLVPTGP